MNIIFASSINRAAQEDTVCFAIRIREFANALNGLLDSDIQVSKIILSYNPEGKFRKEHPLNPEIVHQLNSYSSHPPAECHETDDTSIIRRKKEMKLSGLGYWWLSGIERAFSLGADYVFYYPVDTNWVVSSNNTVVDPNHYIQMIEVTKTRPDLIIGNYKSTSVLKDCIEMHILGYISDAFLDHPGFREFKKYFRGRNAITRVRTEFFGVGKDYFSKFELVNDPQVESSDPTVQLVLEAILMRKSIEVRDLGTYETSDPDNSYVQLDRVKPIIRHYRTRFNDW